MSCVRYSPMWDALCDEYATVEYVRPQHTVYSLFIMFVSITMDNTMNIYGIKNCDTVKKTLNWLDEHGISYTFHDFKKEGVSADKLNAWAKELGWEAFVNKRGTTWRKLDPETQKTVTNQDAAVALMQTHTSVIKRPVIETEKGLVLGFDAEELKRKLA